MGNDGDNFMFLTNLGSPKHRVINVTVNDKGVECENFVDIVAVSTLHGKLFGSDW